jgi:hypothetical protein
MKMQATLLSTAIAGVLALAYPAIVQSQAAAAPAAKTPAAKQRVFASPELAAQALIDAVKARDVNGMLAIVGPASKAWLFSGDPVADANDWKRFMAAYDERKAVRRDGDSKAILEVGGDDWPFPAPLVRKGASWMFDADAGREELVNRRVGRNELDTVQALLAVVDAQREYAASDADRNGFADYARRFRSSEGKRDGLYWPESAGAPRSPLGPLVAVAAKEGYGKAQSTGKPAPYRGYHYRLLTAQGPKAAGGAYDYLVSGKLLGGFAVVAYPATYGNSGVMTFMVNHDGVVYEKDLGAKTESIAAGMKRFDPDATWRKAE